MFQKLFSRKFSENMKIFIHLHVNTIEIKKNNNKICENLQLTYKIFKQTIHDFQNRNHYHVLHFCRLPDDCPTDRSPRAHIYIFSSFNTLFLDKKSISFWIRYFLLFNSSNCSFVLIQLRCLNLFLPKNLGFCRHPVVFPAFRRITRKVDN